LFALSYVVVLGPWLTTRVRTPADAFDHPRRTGLILLALVFLVPAAAAAALHYREVSKLYPDEPFKKKFKTYNPTPTAWDFAVTRVAPGFVRVLTKGGSWVGGYAGPNSFYSTYPEPREMFVEQAWKLDEDGAFVQAVEGTTGLWIECGDAPVVQFLVDTEQQGDKDPDDE
jgi:hypothetical protein